jgi:HD-GYP domain-containing protein (c-di-GMP phosphodiesterase class II)
VSEAADERVDLTKMRATAREEEAEVGVSRERGLDLVNELFMATRTFVIHSAENEATNYSIERMVKTIRALIEGLGTAQFIVAEGEAYINDVRIRVEARNYGNLQHITSLLAGHECGGLTLSRSLSDEEARALTLALVARPPKDRDKLESLRAAIAEGDVPVAAEMPFVQAMGDEEEYDDEDYEDDEDVGEEATTNFAYGIAALRDYADVVVSEGFANPLKVRRAVQEMIDLSVQDFDASLKLHTIQGADDPYFNHSLNVANLAIAVGQKLGMSKVHLRELGSAAVFHDVGYTYLEPAVKGDPEFQRRREENRQLHPVTGVMIVGNEKGYQPHKARRMRVALEHHMHFRRPGGFPPIFTNRLGVFSRIVQVCDHYDAMVAPDPETGEHEILPPQALQRVIAGSGTRFDPVIVRAFVQVMGRYPFGTLIRLNTREIGIVISSGRPGDGFKRPVVRLIVGRDNERLDEAVDLMDEDQRHRWIVKALNPEDAGIDIRGAIFGDASALGDVAEETAPPPPPVVAAIGPETETETGTEIEDEDEDEDARVSDDDVSTVTSTIRIVGPDNQVDEMEVTLEIEDFDSEDDEED